MVDRQTVAWGCLPQRAAKDKELSEEAHTSTPTRVRLFGNHQMKVILAVSCIRPGLLVPGPQAKRMTNPNRRQNNRINLPASGWRTLRSEDRFKMCASKPEATTPKSKRDRRLASRIRPLTIGSMTLFQQKLLSGPGLLVLHGWMQSAVDVLKRTNCVHLPKHGESKGRRAIGVRKPYYLQ